ncbi:MULTISPECIES: hypothetical protein [Bacillus cereus group]|uniref:hypothetical protein n=1 Tax=Bacillus cereus group TaxID=86661 RepID=UPI001C729E02|nr:MULTISPECIES: hypothetical protein [Bacillus cereus group]MBX0351812.1 hypothetical protein [Bacillus toyonensis]MDA2716777.1 hypothetical protein [Bacillus cereus group sp. Bc025]
MELKVCLENESFKKLDILRQDLSQRLLSEDNDLGFDYIVSLAINVAFEHYVGRADKKGFSRNIVDFDTNRYCLYCDGVMALIERPFRCKCGSSINKEVYYRCGSCSYIEEIAERCTYHECENNVIQLFSGS